MYGNYQPQPQVPSYQSFMRSKMEQAQASADREYYEMMNGHQQTQTPISAINQPSIPNIQHTANYNSNSIIQPQNTSNKNAYSIPVSSEQQAESYPVNQNLDDMFFLCGNTLFVKTFDLGKGKWNDMKKFELVESKIENNYVEKIPESNELINKFEELKKFVMSEIEDLKKELLKKSDDDECSIVEETIVYDDEELEDEYEEVIVKQIKKKPTVKTETAKANTTNKTVKKGDVK